MSRPLAKTSQVFVIVAGDEAVMAFEAMSAREAKPLAQETWLVDELKSRGLYQPPLRLRFTGLGVRIANSTEAARYEAAKASAIPSENDDLFTYYLV